MLFSIFFLPVLAAGLQRALGNRLRFGLLTSCGQSHLDQELQEPTYLASVIEMVNPDFVFSSREGGRTDQFDNFTHANHTETVSQLGWLSQSRSYQRGRV